MKKRENSSKERGNKENRKTYNKKDSSQFMDSTFEQKSRRNFRHNRSGKHDINGKIFPENSVKKAISEKSSVYNIPSNAHVISLRKRVDPETAKYFSEIANLFESNGVDLEVRPTVCANALEETRGKEVELSTDMIISRTIQCLLEGCDLEQLCSFIQASAEGFSVIVADKFGSHVAETAMKSLAMHLHDDQSYSMVEEALHKICQVVVADIVNLMCSPYGSHVLRSLFCLLKGVELNTLQEFHVTKPSAILTERLSFTPAQPRGSILKNPQNSFPDVFVFLVQETLNHAQAEISTLRSNRYSSFVLQSILKLLVGDDQALLHAILILLGCQEDNFLESKLSNSTHEKLKEVVMSLLEDTASSHLLEVIIQVAPADLYNVFLDVIFKGSLFRISSHRFGNFVMQALISSIRTHDHASLIWEELGPHLGQLLEEGKAGVVTSILAAFQRLQTHVNQFCHALAVAVCPESEMPRYIVPHLLFLDSYFREKTQWKWSMEDKMHVLGCLMLQNIFKISNNLIKPYVASITTMEADHIVETAKDVGGSHVLEAFLCSDVSSKQKHEVISKLLGHFGELSLQPSGSFAVEKSFTASNNDMRMTIASELVEVQTELSKIKHGPYLLRKLDIEGFARSPDQWKSRLASKAAAYLDFVKDFGSNEQPALAPDSLQKSSKKKCPRKDKWVGTGDFAAESSLNPASVMSGKLRFLSSSSKPSHHFQMSSNSSASKEDKRRFIRSNMSGNKPVVKSDKKRSSASELAELAAKSKLTQGDVRMLFNAKTLSDKKWHGTTFLKKQKR